MQNKIIIVCGPKDSGKTYRVTELLAACDRAVTFDLIHEAAYGGEGCEVVTGNLRALYEAIPREREHFRVTYRPINVDVQDNGLVACPELEPVIKLCFLRGDTTLVIDEAHLVCNSRNCPRMLMVSNLVGRHRELSLVLVCQKLNVIPSAIRENTDEFYFWKIIEPASLDAVEDRCGREVRDQVAALRPIDRDEDTGAFRAPGQCLHWTKFKGVVEVTE